MSDRQATVVGPRTNPEVGEAVLARLPNGFVVRSPLSVAVWREGDEFVADSPFFDLHAFGTSSDDAVANLGVQMVDQWRRLEELGDRLAPRIERQRRRLREFIAAPSA